MTQRQLIGIGCIATMTEFETAAIIGAYRAVLCNFSLRVMWSRDQT